MDVDLAKTKLMLKGLIADAQRASAAELQDLESRLDDAEELSASLISDIGRAIAELTNRVNELATALTALRDRQERLRRGYGGGGADTAPPFDINALAPANPAVTPAEVVVKQNGVWLRMRWNDFVTLVAADATPGAERYASGYADDYTGDTP